MGRASARRVPSGRRISTSCIEAARRGGDLDDARVEAAQVGVDLAQHLDLHGELGVVEGVAVGVEALVGGFRRGGQRAAAGADGEAGGLGGAFQRRLADLGRMRVARGLAAHGAQAEALGGVVGGVPEPAVVEDERFRPPALEEELAVVGAAGGVAQHPQRGLGVEGGLEGAEARGLRHDRGSGWRRRRRARCGIAASCPSPANMVDLGHLQQHASPAGAEEARGGRG